MFKSLIFLLVLLSLIAQAEIADMRPYIPKGKYVDSERGCQVEVTHTHNKIKIGFSVTANPMHMGTTPQDYVIGGNSWIELDAKTGQVLDGASACWSDKEKGPNTNIQNDKYVYGNSCSSEHTLNEKIQIQASPGHFSGLLFQREVFRLIPVDAGLRYEGYEEMHFGCKLTPETRIGSN